jgi:hypothetical protein
VAWHGCHFVRRPSSGKSDTCVLLPPRLPPGELTSSSA